MSNHYKETLFEGNSQSSEDSALICLLIGNAVHLSNDKKHLE